MKVFLFLGGGQVNQRTCLNSRNPFDSVERAVASAHERQAQSRAHGLPVLDYIVVAGGTIQTTVRSNKEGTA